MANYPQIKRNIEHTIEQMLNNVIIDEEIDAPKDLSNMEAYEYIERVKLVAVASATFHLASLSEKYKEISKMKLLDAVDSEKKTIVGLHTVATTPVVNCFMEVKNGAKRLDGKKFASELRKLGVEQSVIDKAQAAAMVTSAPAKTFKFEGV